MWHIWLILTGEFLILEILTTGFFVFWFGIGAILAMIVSFFTSNLIIQSSVFIISSCILILSTKPLVDKLLGNKQIIHTNAYTIVGKTAVVIQEIDSLKGIGQIKFQGEIWSAKSIDEQTIPKDSIVEIISIEGVKACVKLSSVA